MTMLRFVTTALLVSYQAAFGLMGSAGLHAVMGVHHGCYQHAASVGKGEVSHPAPLKQCHGHCCHRHPAPVKVPTKCDSHNSTPGDKHESPPHDHDHCWLCDLWLSMFAPVALPSEVAVVLLPVADALHGKCVVASPVLNAACFIRGPPSFAV